MAHSTSSEITLGYSSCPNDTFIFCALSKGQIDTGSLRIQTRIEDIEILNGLARGQELEVTKISFHAFGHLRDHYALLRSGAALGRGCGPLVVARTPLDPSKFSGKPGDLRIAIPGEWTTAALLLRLFAPQARNFLVCPFGQIFDRVLESRADAGVIIHEGRFTYAARGLSRVLDLGEWWEAETGLPIPLGGIIASRALGTERLRSIEAWVRASVLRARMDPGPALEYARAFAREMDEEVIRAHIDLYVNEFTLNLGSEGERAVRVLLEMAEERGIVPPSQEREFLVPSA